jgi:signal transduction histidine kinase/FixJ family two-component response regulator
VETDRAKKDEVQKAVIINYLEEIAECLAGNFYWKDRDGYYLGCNKSAFNMPGANGQKDVIGKTDYDLWPERAHELRQNDIAVMESGKLLSFEEVIQIGDQIRSYAVVKVPLKNSEGKIVGIIGNSLDITDRKETESLRFQMQEQEKIKIISEQVAHDIRSPLATLSMIVSSLKDIPEKKRIALQSTITSIYDIADNLLNRYRSKKSIEEKVAKDQYVCVPFALVEVINRMKYLHNRLNIKINYFCDADSQFIFLKGDLSVLSRMISNLLNNSIEAFEGKAGIVDTTIRVEGKNCEIIIRDNGKGMPPEHVRKIRNNVAFSSGKKFGHGIGFEQIKDAVNAFGGRLLIESEEKVGTKITVVLPMSEKPSWITDRITIGEGVVLVIVDDDPSMQYAWKFCLEKCSQDLSIKFFEDGGKAISFIESLKNPEGVFLLCDYELRGQELNGIQVVKRLNMDDRSIIITSNCNNRDIQMFAEQSNVPLLPKTFMSEIEIIVEEKPIVVDFVIIDDDVTLSETLAEFFIDEKFSVEIYNSPHVFKSKLSRYPLDTIILMDNDFCDEHLNGLELAKYLHERGYSRLYMISGRDFCEENVPPYLKILTKGNMNDLAALVENYSR